MTVNKADVQKMVQEAVDHIPIHMEENMPALNQAAAAVALVSCMAHGSGHDDEGMTAAIQLATMALLVGAYNPQWVRAGHWDLVKQMRTAYRRHPEWGPEIGEGAELTVLIWEVVVGEIPGYFPTPEDVPLDDLL